VRREDRGDESTGTCRIALYEVLERRGFEVLLVNAPHVRNVSGRKADELGRRSTHASHRQQLLTFGLPRGAFTR
jgi:transposase